MNIINITVDKHRWMLRVDIKLKYFVFHYHIEKSEIVDFTEHNLH